MGRQKIFLATTYFQLKLQLDGQRTDDNDGTYDGTDGQTEDDDGDDFT